MTTLAIDIGGIKLAAALIGADGQIAIAENFLRLLARLPQALRCLIRISLSAYAQRVAIASTGIIRDGSCWR